MPALAAVSEIVHCDDVIAGDDKPSQAIRRAKTTSMGRAIAAVKAGEAQAAVSGGNTGALMAMAKLALRTMPGIDRPALAALLPTLGDNDLVMLDLGANTECDASNLVQFAVMGAAYARVVLELERAAGAAAQHRHRGAEGHRRAQGGRRDPARRRLSAACASTASSRATRSRAATSTSIVTDGFSGNIALKIAGGHRPLRHRPAAPRLHQLDPLEDRLPDLAPGDRTAPPPSRSQQP